MVKRRIFVWVTLISCMGETREETFIAVGKTVEQARKKVLKTHFPVPPDEKDWMSYTIFEQVLMMEPCHSAPISQALGV